MDYVSLFASGSKSYFRYCTAEYLILLRIFAGLCDLRMRSALRAIWKIQHLLRVRAKTSRNRILWLPSPGTTIPFRLSFPMRLALQDDLVALYIATGVFFLRPWPNIILKTVGL